MAYSFDWLFLWDSLPSMFAAWGRTVLISIIGIAGALVLGFLGGWARHKDVPRLSGLLAAYVEIIRNIPHLLIIMFLYFGLPDMGLSLTSFMSACLALSLIGAAYNIEAMRAGFAAVPANYVRASRALGMTARQAFTSVIVPNGVRIALPSLGNNSVGLIKTSSLMMAIGYPDLMATVVSEVSLTFRVAELFLVMGVMYLITISIASQLFAQAERRLAFQAA